MSKTSTSKKAAPPRVVKAYVPKDPNETLGQLIERKAKHGWTYLTFQPDQPDKKLRVTFYKTVSQADNVKTPLFVLEEVSWILCKAIFTMKPAQYFQVES